MKKFIVFTLCVVTALSLAACGNTSKPANNAEATSENVQIPNPFVSCVTLGDAGKLAGFDITVPETVAGYDNREITVIEKDMIQVTFRNGDDLIYFRKGIGTVI